jgi:hypothetical protein
LNGGVHNEGNRVDSIAIAGLKLFENKSKERIVVEACNSFTNRKERIIAGNASKEVNNIIFFEPFSVAANM